MKIKTVSIAFAALAAAGYAHAAYLPTTVTATGTYGNNLGVINDKVFPADYTPYNDPTSVYFGPGDFSGPTATFNFDLGGLQSVGGIVATVDNNDDYVFTFYNGAAVVETYTYAASDGTVTYGLQNFSTLAAAPDSPDTPTFTPVSATNVVVTAINGDDLYGIGEVEFTPGGGGGVPEPASWALMLTGFGLVGAAVRRRAQPVRV